MSKFFPFTGGGGSLDKIFFFQSEHVSSQIWCQQFFPLLGWRSLDKKFFSPSEHVSSQIWCQKIFPLLRPGTPPDLDLGLPLPDLDLGPPLPGPGLGTPPTQTWTWDPPYLDLDLGPPPEMLTDRHLYKQYLLVILRMRAVIITFLEISLINPRLCKRPPCGLIQFVISHTTVMLINCND